MTTSQQRAAEVMRNLWHDGRYAAGVAKALSDAGLITPDLPEPLNSYKSVFRVASPLLDCRSVQVVGDQVAIHGYKSRHAPIEEARRFADALYAAIDYAERNQK